MIIYSKTGEIILDIEVDDTSYRYRAIRQGDKVYLYFSLTEHVEIPIYSYINYQGQRYTLWKPENLTKNGERNLDYVVEFGGYWELLNRTKYKFLSGKPHKLKFPLTGTPRMFMQLLIDNLNLHDTGWKLGTCIDASEKTLTFSHETCMAVLNRLADEYNTEFEFISKTINFGKIERFKDDPLPLSYGKGNGFKTGVIRQSQGEKNPITILYIQGGERNIDYSTYGSASLLLPKSQEFEYQGRCYKTDPDGMYITRADRPLIDFNEDGYDASNIYPSRVGSISEVVTVDVSKNFYDIKDSSIPNALDYSKCRIAGEKATIIFQSGILAGREFDLEQTDDALTGYVHSERRFKIVPIEQDGTIMPNETFKPAVGDKYAIFNISLPQAYVCDNASQSGASWDMFKEAVRYMYENEEESFTFKGDLDSVWSKKKWPDIAAKLEPGSYIQFSDTQFQPEGILIRITGIKDYINKPFAPEIELSNTPVAGYVSSELGKIDSNEVKDEDRYNNSIFYTKRSWKDVKETQKMMFDPDGSFKQEYTAALLAEFGHLVIGMKSQQMDLIGVKFIPNADNNANSFKSTAGKLVHLTIKDTPAEWTIPASSHSLSSSLYYYVYAKCSRTGSTGSIYVTNQQIKFDSDSSYYYFWIGTLNTPEDNVRSWLPLYGYTEIAGQTITTGVIKDKLARLVIDLAKAKITATNGATIEGTISFGEGSSGLENLAEWPGVKKIIDNTEREISETIQALNNFEDTVNGTFKDGIIQEAEAKAIEKYINTLNTEKAEADAAYNKLYANIYLLGTPKTDLLNSKTTYNGAHTNLINSVNSAVADGKTTVAEKNDVDSKFTAYKNALADYKSKVEAANKAIQDTLKGYSDQALNKGEEAFTAASNAQTSANQASLQVSNLSNYVDGAFSDGIIQEAEAKAIEKYINTLNTEKASVEATYNKLYANTYLTGTAKTGLLNAKVSLFGAIDNLMSAISGAISDGKTTAYEKNNVDSKFSSFNSAMSTFNTAVEVANKAIQDKLKEYSDTAANTVPDSFKNTLAQRLGYSNYPALETAANAGKTIVKNGKINTVLIEAAAIVAEGLTAKLIEALKIVTGNLTVTSGAKIGGFTVSNGWLRANATPGNDIGYIDMLSNDSRISFGTSVGNPYTTTQCTAIIENRNPHSGGSGLFAEENIALRLKSWSSDENTALDAIGGFRWLGRTMNVNAPIMIYGSAMRDVIEVKIRYANEYVLNPQGYVAVDLPGSSIISKAFGMWSLPGVSGSVEDSSLIQINIMVPFHSSGQLLVRGVSEAPLKNVDGNTITEDSGYSYGNVKLTKGDQLCLAYMNRAWYIRYISR